MSGWAVGLALAGVLAACTAQGQTNAGPNEAYVKYLNERLQRMAAALNLTEEQQAKLKAINEEEVAAVAKWNEEYRALTAENNAALRGKDEAASRKAQEAMRAAGERRAGITTGSAAKIRAVITDAKWQEWQTSELAASWLKRFEAANLTAEQKEKLRALCAETLLAGDSGTNAAAARTTAYRKLSESAQSMLTPEQREEVAIDNIQKRALRLLPDVEFTPEQKAKIRTICQAAAKAEPEVGGKAGGTSLFRSSREVEKKIVEEVMTEAQRGALEGSRFFQQISYAVTGCEPTPEQIAKMKALCQETAKGFTTNMDYKVRAAKAREAIETIRSTILTEAQRAKVPVPPPVVGPAMSAPAPVAPPVAPPPAPPPAPVAPVPPTATPVGQ
jgi:Spy/CpxP family protein refolding chaperone